MINISFKPQTPTEIDEFLRELSDAAIAENEPIRLRIQPQLYHPTANNYKAWRMTTWTLEVKTREELLALREAIGLLFTVMELSPMDAVVEWLQKSVEDTRELKRQAEEGQEQTQDA
jgi:hypothetical protein